MLHGRWAPSPVGDCCENAAGWFVLEIRLPPAFWFRLTALAFLTGRLRECRLQAFGSDHSARAARVRSSTLLDTLLDASTSACSSAPGSGSNSSLVVLISARKSGSLSVASNAVRSSATDPPACRAAR